MNLFQHRSCTISTLELQSRAFLIFLLVDIDGQMKRKEVIDAIDQLDDVIAKATHAKALVMRESLERSCEERKKDISAFEDFFETARQEALQLYKDGQLAWHPDECEDIEEILTLGVPPQLTEEPYLVNVPFYHCTAKKCFYKTNAVDTNEADYSMVYPWAPYELARCDVCLYQSSIQCCECQFQRELCQLYREWLALHLLSKDVRAEAKRK